MWSFASAVKSTQTGHVTGSSTSATAAGSRHDTGPR
jgi:hypothetical protein